MRYVLFASLLAATTLLLVAATLPVHAKRTPAECLDLGFNKDVVRCKYCEKLFLVTQSAEMQQECQDCCTAENDDVDEANKKYPAARIEGRYIFRALEASSVGSLAVFYRTYKEEPYFQYLSFNDEYAALYPQIVLVDDEGKDAATVRITMWSPETLHKFFSKKIKVE
jgi:hypothetical protein